MAGHCEAQSQLIDKCSVCSKQYKEPKLLPCGHTFCVQCLKGLVTGSVNSEVLYERAGASPSDVTLTCPECGHSHGIPSAGIHAFTTDYCAIQAIEADNWHICMKQKSSSCGVCESSGQVESFCSECVSFLCQQCTAAHKRMKTFAEHHLSPPHPSTLTLPPIQRPVFCSQHPTVIVNMYCVTCEMLICNECLCLPVSLAVTSNHHSPTHTAHAIHPITDQSLALLQERIDQLLSQVHTLHATLQHSLIQLETQEDGVKVHPEKLKRAVNETVDSWIVAMETTRQRALSQIDESCAQAVKFCQEQKTIVSESIKNVECGLRFASKAAGCEGRSLKFVMLSQAWSLLETPLKVCRTQTTPTSCSFYQVRTPHRESTSMDLLVTREQSLTISKISRVVLGKRSSLDISFRHKPTETPVFRVAFLGRHKRFIDMTNCSHKDQCMWEVEFIPVCIGRYQVEAQVFGKWIASPPFTTSPLSQLEVGHVVRLSPDAPFELLFLKPSDSETGRIETVRYSSSDSGRTINYMFEITWGRGPESSQFNFSHLRNSYDPFPLELAMSDSTL